MKKKYIAFSCAAALSLIFASCASKPKVEEPAPAENKPVEKIEETQEEAPAVQEDDTSSAEAQAKARAQADEQYQKALQAKAKIEELGFASYSQEDYDGGNASLAEYESKKDSEDVAGTELLALADSAYGKFVNVLNKAFKKLAKEARIAAFNEKKNADGVKAAVAAKAEYAAAADEFKSGDTNYAMQNPESAYKHYLAAKDKFAALYASVSKKRAAAQTAIDEAKAKVESAENYAINADHEKPLEGENIEGIEAEDAVLLEADDYAAPETLEAEIPEVLDVQEDDSDSAAEAVEQEAE